MGKEWKIYMYMFKYTLYTQLCKHRDVTDGKKVHVKPYVSYKKQIYTMNTIIKLYKFKCFISSARLKPDPTNNDI